MQIRLVPRQWHWDQMVSTLPVVDVFQRTCALGIVFGHLGGRTSSTGVWKFRPAISLTGVGDFGIRESIDTAGGLGFWVSLADVFSIEAETSLVGYGDLV